MTTLNGIQLSGRYYWEAVRPLLDQHFLGLPHAAALLGNGSEVLGYDGTRPRPTIIAGAPGAAVCAGGGLRAGALAAPLHTLLADRLPRRFGGYPTNFSDPDPLDHGVQHLEEVDDGPVNHRVDVLTAAAFVERQLNFDLAQPLEPIDWLTFPEQKLLSITAGAVFYDTIGLADLRGLFAYYPQDVWLYLLAAAWARIGQEEHLMGRAGQAGDELGSGLIGARLVPRYYAALFSDGAHLCAYAKWFGTAFRRLHSGPELYPILQRALAAATWQAREEHLGAAYEYAAAMHNRLRLTPPLPERTCQFFGRPFRVIALHGYAGALCAQIEDAQVRALAEAALVGGIDLVSDNVDIVANGRFRSALRKLYELEA